MDKEIHQNYIKASNLIFGTIVLGLINVVISNRDMNDTKNIITIVVTFLFIAGIGYLIRIGKEWIKYLLLIFLVFGLITMLFIIPQLLGNSIIFIINITQTLMQLLAIYLLFKIPKIETTK